MKTTKPPVAKKTTQVKKATSSSTVKKTPAKPKCKPEPVPEAPQAEVAHEVAIPEVQQTDAVIAPELPVGITKKRITKDEAEKLFLPELREIRNGVKLPLAATTAGELWNVLDSLLERLGRAPARFEFRGEAELLNAKRIGENLTPWHPDTVSMQYFKWRTFYGIKARETGLSPKRNSFEVSVKVEKVKKQRNAKVESVIA